VAIGTAPTGSRPVAEIMYMDCIGLACSRSSIRAAKLRYMSGVCPRCTGPPQCAIRDCGAPQIEEATTAHTNHAPPSGWT
jgi:pyruvate/2-oxoglutarate/acetoin dehydrogenase E1 component